MTDRVHGAIHFSVPDITDADIEAVAAVLRSKWLTTGSVAIELEEQLQSYLGVEHVACTSSCTTALECGLASLRLPPESRVGIPAWTFAATATVVIRQGHVPVLIDVDPDTLNIDAARLAEEASRLDAAILVHFGGTPVHAAAYSACERGGVPVIEDAAHAMGARLDPARPVVASAYSFYATKNLTSAEGGALATPSPEVANFARAYRLHGMSRDAWRRYLPGAPPTYDVIMPGIKANLPDVLASLALSQLSRFDELQARRRAAVTQYRCLLADVPGLRCVPAEADDASADHLMVVVLPSGTDRSSVVDHLSAHGIGTSVHFTPLHHFSGLKDHVEVPRPLTVADGLADRALSLPLDACITGSDIERVVTHLAEALRG